MSNAGQYRQQRQQADKKISLLEGARRVTQVPKRNWIYRNPRLFNVIFITSGLLIFFSKPLYDAFIADPPIGPVPSQSLRRRV